MKKSIIAIILSMMVILSGCSNINDEYEKFSEDIKNEQYLHALGTYENNKDNEEFKAKADDLISFEMIVVNSNITEDNIKSVKKFRDFAEETLGSDSTIKLDASIEKFEKGLYVATNSEDTTNDKEEETVEKTTEDTAAKTESSNDSSTKEKTDTENVDTDNFSYASYENSKYKYKINYPNYLKGDTSSSADNIELSANSGSVKLIIGGSNNTSNISVNSSYNEYMSKAEGVTYKYKNSRMYVVSGIQSNGTSYYHYEAIGKGSINSFTFYWPTKDTKYKAVVQELYDSFKTPSIDASH